MIGILSVIALILGFLYGKNIYYLRKKNKAYELDSETDNNLIKEDKEEKEAEKENFSINV